MFGKWPTRIFVSAEMEFTATSDKTVNPKVDNFIRDCRSWRRGSSESGRAPGAKRPLPFSPADRATICSRPDNDNAASPKSFRARHEVHFVRQVLPLDLQPGRACCCRKANPPGNAGARD